VCKSWYASNPSQVATGSRCASLSHKIKSKQFVFIKKNMSVQVLQWNRNAWRAPPGPRPTEKALELFFPSSLMGANTTTWSVRAIELWKASTLKDRNFHASQQPLHYLTWSLQTSSGAAQLPTETFINIPINFLYTVSTVSTSNLVSSIRAQDCM